MRDWQDSGGNRRPASAASGRRAGETRPKARPQQQDIVSTSRRTVNKRADVPKRRQNPEEQHEGQGRRRQSSMNRWFRAIVMVAGTVVGCVFLALFILQSAYDLFGLNKQNLAVEVTIPKGASISDVSKLLKETGIVDRPLSFRIYAGIKAKDNEMQPGDYVFNANMGYSEIIMALTSGLTTKEVVRLTFIEGSTLLDIANQLEENKVCKADAFIEYMDTAEYNYEFFGAIEDSGLRFHKLEGYLFPDTYDFYMGENVDSVARKFIRNFNDKLTPELKNRMQDLNLTIDETITLASIIQKEAGESEDMRLVSSVFHNRLNASVTYPNLQSDVTIFYVETDIKPLLKLSNQALYDAYNTYIREGLPVGPICNPGENAIRAALYPESTDFYFFVTDKNMDFYYAKTSDEHYRYVAIAQQVGGEAHGINTR